MASVHNAKQVYKRHRRTNQFESRPAFDSVMTVCATFEHEVQALTSILSYYCDHVRILSRSTATEYQWLDKHIPFLDDIIEAGKSVVQKDSEYYLMVSCNKLPKTSVRAGSQRNLAPLEIVYKRRHKRRRRPVHFHGEKSSQGQRGGPAVSKHNPAYYSGRERASAEKARR